MAIVLDYTYRIDPAALRAAGVSGVCRYLKPDSVPEYRITLAEYRELLAAGIDVTLNWEYDGHDWLGGASHGTSHGQTAVAQAKALSYPAGSVIVGSADFDMTVDQWNSAGRAYAVAFAAAIRAGGYRPGVYGPWDVLSWVSASKIMDAFWQCMSKAYSSGRNTNPWPGAHLWQRGYKTVAGQQTDWNQIQISNWGGTMADFDPYGAPASLGGRQVGVLMADVWGNEMGGVSPYDNKSPSFRTQQLTGLGHKADQLLSMAAAQEQRDNAALAAITALTTLIQNAGGNIDAAPILAAVKAAGDDTHALVASLQQQVAALQTELDAVKAAAEVGLSPAERAALPTAQ